MKIFAFAASFRKGSFNRKLISQAVTLMGQMPGIQVDHADFHEFDMPVYDGDLEETSGIPPGAKGLIRRIRDADAMVISTPEYNGGIPGPLKNAMDWVSREKPIAFTNKHLLLLGASPGALGAVRGLWHTRVPFEAIGTFVFPEMFGMPLADSAFDEQGGFKDPKYADRLRKLLGKFLETIS